MASAPGTFPVPTVQAAKVTYAERSWSRRLAGAPNGSYPRQVRRLAEKPVEPACGTPADRGGYSRRPLNDPLPAYPPDALSRRRYTTISDLPKDITSTGRSTIIETTDDAPASPITAEADLYAVLNRIWPRSRRRSVSPASSAPTLPFIPLLNMVYGQSVHSASRTHVAVVQDAGER